MEEMNFEGLAKKLSELTGYMVSADELLKFAVPYKADLAAGDRGLLQGSSQYFSDDSFGATFELSLEDETLIIQRIYPDKEVKPEDTVRETLHGLIYLAENPNSGAIMNLDKGRKRMSFNVI
jgi:hypothetical protein